ncbi:MAG: tetratricopeptide repeat protein, partial [Proteobacteria bacterium]|nr:tetratricopeptide repeat protein [Pseudomonadota bacterium]
MSVTLEDHRQSFEDDPGDNRAFEALDEHHFLAGEWEELVTLYRRRADAPTLEDQPAVRVAVLFRLGQLLEERCLRADDALECYWEVARLDPQCRPALRQARQIHAQRSQWDLVLQIAELEGEIPMEPYEKAAFLSEMGDVWLAHLSDPAQALECFDGALETNAGMQDALAGRARCLQELGRLDEAVTTWELLTEAQRGPDRAPTLVSLAKLMAGRMGQPDRAAELYRRALTEDPRNQDAVEALVQLATSREQWPLLADLYERQFDLAAGARRRTAIALEAGRLHLDHLDHPQAARMWLDRAVELCPDDADVQRARADLERRAGNGDALLEALDQVISLDAEGSSTSIVVEAAQLHSHAGNEERARAHLELAHQSAPNDPRVLEALSATLAKLGRGAELAEILEQRASLAGNDLQARVAALRELGRIYDEDLADTEAALDAYMRAFDAQPDAPEIASTLELLCRKAEAWEPLRAVLERASREGPAEERLTRACALGELLDERFDDQEGATRAFEAALEFDPGFERGLRGLERIALATGNE